MYKKTGNKKRIKYKHDGVEIILPYISIKLVYLKYEGLLLNIQS